jgi:hypothetical protein
LREGQITAFTGAGISAPEFPTWSELLLMLLQQAHEEGLISGDLKDYASLISSDALELAEQLEQAFTHEVFRSRLASIFRNSSGKTTEVVGFKNLMRFLAYDESKEDWLGHQKANNGKKEEDKKGVLSHHPA